MDIIRLDFKSGLEALLKSKPIRAIFLGVRIGDPTAVFFMLYVDKCMTSLCIVLLARLFSIIFYDFYTKIDINSQFPSHCQFKKISILID